MAHYQWVYGKITQPSDKLVVIDSELETYAPVESDARRLQISLVLKMAHSVKKKYEHIETIILQRVAAV